MKLALASAALAISACATVQQQATTLSSPLLCYVQYAGNLTDKSAAGPELERRGFSCTADDVAAGSLEYQQRMASQQWPRQGPLYVSPPEARTSMHCETHGSQTNCW